MTTIDEVLGKCLVRRSFDTKQFKTLPANCYGCPGYKHDAIKRDCQNYTPYLLRHYHENIKQEVRK